MRIIVFGTGKFCENRKDILMQEEVIAFADNDISKQGLCFNGIQIISPEKILQERFDKIILMSPQNQESIQEQLLTMGISKHKIIDFRTFQQNGNMHNMVVYYADKESNRKQENKNSRHKKIIMISHELELAGAPIVLFYAAKVLKKNGYEVTVASPADGKLREKYIKEGIAVVIDASIREKDGCFDEWMKFFDIVFVCTLALSSTIEQLQKIKRPIIWWLHESKRAYEIFGKGNLQDLCADNISIYTGGDRALKYYQLNFHNNRASNLLYGIPDTYSSKRKRKEKKEFLFAIIGTVNERKAQDIFLQAIRLLPTEELDYIKFLIIGKQENNEYCEQIRKEAERNPYVELKNEMTIQELNEIYEDIDVVVCPSRDDPMPVVLTEAMMHHKVCIMSDSTGTSNLIIEGKNGFVCKTNEPKSLTDKIQWIIQHKETTTSIGEEARKIYDNNFTMECFQSRLLQILDEIDTNMN